MWPPCDKGCQDGTPPVATAGIVDIILARMDSELG